MMFKHLVRHVGLEIADDGERTRHDVRLVQHSINFLEREILAMALNTKDILNKLQQQSTQIDGVLMLCDTLHNHLDTVIKKLNDGSVDNAEVQADLQAMSDLLDRQAPRIANAITSDADISDAPPVPVGTPPAPSETGDTTGIGGESPLPAEGSGDLGSQGQPQTGDNNPAPNPNEPGTAGSPVGTDQSSNT